MRDDSKCCHLTSMSHCRHKLTAYNIVLPRPGRSYSKRLVRSTWIVFSRQGRVNCLKRLVVRWPSLYFAIENKLTSVKCHAVKLEKRIEFQLGRLRSGNVYLLLYQRSSREPFKLASYVLFNPQSVTETCGLLQGLGGRTGPSSKNFPDLHCVPSNPRIACWA
jgi:hypothetical protein